MPEGSLAGRRILIVEDEYYLADDLARALEGAGAEIVGPVGTLDEAEEKVRAGGFDGAVLDMNLHGDMAVPLAERLDKAEIPFIIATGYSHAPMPPHLAGVPRVEKPFDSRAVVEKLAELVTRSA